MKKPHGWCSYDVCKLGGIGVKDGQFTAHLTSGTPASPSDDPLGIDLDLHRRIP